MHANPAALLRLSLPPYARKFGACAILLLVGWIVLKLWLPIGSTTFERVTAAATQRGNEDYVAFYAAGRLVIEGRGDALYDVDAIGSVERDVMGRPVGGSGVLPFFNPPFVAVLFAPLSLASVQVFAAAIFAANAAMVVGSGLLLQRFIAMNGRLPRLSFWLIYLSLYSVSWAVLQGQLSLLLLLAWFGFLWFAIKGQERHSGVSLALMLIKPQMALLPLALLVWKRRWEALRPFAVIAVLLAGASVAVCGPQIVIDYPRFLLNSSGWVGQGVNTREMFGWNGLLVSLSGEPRPSPILIALLVAPSLALAAWAFRGPWRPGAPRFLPQSSLLILVALLVNPHLYMQDLVLVALAFALVYRYAMSTTTALSESWRRLATASWLAQLFALRLQIDHGVNLLTPLLAATLVLLVVDLRSMEGRVESDAAAAPRRAA